MVYLITFLLTLFFNFSLESKLHPSSLITYSLSGGRLGDNLLAFSHAAWLSHVVKIPLAYFPFDHSNELYLSSDPLLVHVQKTNGLRNCEIKSERCHLQFYQYCLSKKVEPPMFFTLKYFPESTFEYLSYEFVPFYHYINWDDPVFIQRLRTLIAPIKPVEKPVLPANRVSVAMHVRIEDENVWPMKSPAIDYYVDALETISSIIEEPLYIFIFTDFNKPEQIATFFKNRFPSTKFLFNCHKNENAKSINLFDDFFAMGAFECLIRPDSNFSLIASKIFSYRIILAPFHCEKNSDRKYFIDQMLLQIGSVDGDIKPIRTLLPRKHRPEGDKFRR